MTRLMLVVEVEADPARLNPHDMGHDLVDFYEDHTAAAEPRVTFVSAEWAVEPAQCTAAFAGQPDQRCGLYAGHPGWHAVRFLDEGHPEARS